MNLQISLLSSLIVTPLAFAYTPDASAQDVPPPLAADASASHAPAPAPEPAPAPTPAPVEGATTVAPEQAPSAEPPAVETTPPPAQEPTPPVATGEEEAPPPPPSEEVPEGFVMEDLSEDPEALAKELQAGAKQATGAVGSVVGVVRGSDGQPLIGAWVEVVGQSFAARSGVDGSFTLDLKPGTYEIRVRMDGFSPRRVGDIEVKVGEKVNLDSTLVPLPGAVQTVIVAATINKEGESGRLIERQQSRATRDIMSREEISRSGGGSTASVARRIVGTTIVGGRYLFVRGLGHRYGNTLMDGARVPSPDPDLRTVPLDLFPSTALSAINVQKTFTPDVPGDFTGGSVQLETRDMPEQFTANVRLGSGANTSTTFQKMVSSDGVGIADAFGFGNIKRGLSSAIPKNDLAGYNVQSLETLGAVHTPEQIEKQGESIYAKTQVLRDKNAPVNLLAQANIGNSWKLGEKSRLGFFLAGGYNNTYQSNSETIRRFAGAGGVLAEKAPLSSFETQQTIHRVQLNGLGLIKYKFANLHRLSLTSFYTRDAEEENRIYRGRISTNPGDIYTTRQRYIARSLWTTALAGSNVIPPLRQLKIDWNGTYARAQRDDPAMRDVVYNDTVPGQTPTVEGGNSPPGFLYTDLIDDTISGSTSLTLPFKQWKQLDGLVKAGVWGENKDRNFDVRRFRFESNGRVEPSLGNFLNKDSIVGGANNTDNGTWYLLENTAPNDNYRGSHSIASCFLLTDLPINWWFRISGGARVENSVLRVTPFNPLLNLRGTMSPPSRLHDLDVLPALSFVFSPRKDLNIRLSGTKTIARPEMRELAPFRFTDFVGGSEYFGNPDLKSTRIWNADARVEWFPTAGDIVAASIFAKSFDKPIESTVAVSTGGGLMTYRNAKSALNLGAEIEIRKKLGFISPKMDFLAVGTNFAYIYSQVNLGAVQCIDGADCTMSALDTSTSRKRPLQGQSPLVLNSFLDFDFKKTETSLRLLYNTFGRRINAIGGFGLPDIYDESVHSLDFTASQTLWSIKPAYNDDGEQTNRSHNLRLILTGQNLANSPIRRTQGPNRTITYRAYTGATFNVSLAWGF